MLKLKPVGHSILQRRPWAAGSDTKSPSLAQIYQENARYVFRCLRHLGVRPADLEDITHEVFLVIERRLESFEGRSALRTWIYGVAVRVASDYRKKAVFRREVLDGEFPEQKDEGRQAEGLEREDFRRRLSALLEQLSPEQREVFVLYEMEELNMKDVAEALDCPLQTAYSRLHAARNSLRALLKQEDLHP